MSSFEWVSNGGFCSVTPDVTQNFELLVDMPFDWTFVRAIISYECTYEFLEDPTTPLGTWLPTAVAAYWRFGVVAHTPRQIFVDSGGDYSEYRGMNWDDAVVPFGPPDTVLHQFYAPRDGAPLDVQGERRMDRTGETDNGFWITAGLAFNGSLGPPIFPRTFMMSGAARILFLKP